MKQVLLAVLLAGFTAGAAAQSFTHVGDKPLGEYGRYKHYTGSMVVTADYTLSAANNEWAPGDTCFEVSGQEARRIPSVYEGTAHFCADNPMKRPLYRALGVSAEMLQRRAQNANCEVKGRATIELRNFVAVECECDSDTHKSTVTRVVRIDRPARIDCSQRWDDY